MIKHGLKPCPPDHRDYSHHRTFGAITTFPVNLNTDVGLTLPDQNAEGLPYGCTGETQSDICVDQDSLLYKARFTYEKTKLIEGLEGDVPVGIKESLKSTIVYGVQEINESSDMEAFQHRRGAYYNVEKVGDYFDGIRSALMKSNSVSIGTPWMNEWSFPQNGIIPDVATPSGSWHNWKICGWKTINGKPYLIGKTWQGKNYGDNGFAYFSRETINKVLDIWGTCVYVLDKKISDPKTVQLEIIEVIVSYLNRMFAIIQGLWTS